MVPSKHKTVLFEVITAPCEAVEETIATDEGSKFVSMTPVAVLGPWFVTETV